MSATSATILGPEAFDPAWHRIMIMGPSGSGKTTLGKEIGALLNLPVVHLDRLFWLPGWQERPLESFLSLVQEAAAGERWVIEGNYRKTIEPRLTQAHGLIYLDLPRRVYLPQVLWRQFRDRGGARDDLQPENREHIEWAHTRELWNHDRDRRPRRAIEMREYAEQVPVIWLQSRHEVRKLQSHIIAIASGLE